MKAAPTRGPGGNGSWIDRQTIRQLTSALPVAIGFAVGAWFVTRKSSSTEAKKDPTEDKPKNGDASEGIKTTAAWLLTGFTLLIGALTTLGAAQGGLERLLRNYKIQAAIALILGVLSLGLAAGAMLLDSKSEHNRRRLLVVSVVLFTLALLIGVSFSVLTPSTREQPFVAAKVTRTEQGLALEGTVKAAGLRSDENLRIVVHPLVLENEDYALGGRHLYDADIGPDSAGKVDFTFQLPLEPDQYAAVDVVAGIAGNLGATCFDPNLEAGCLVIKMPRATPTPTPSPPSSS